MAKRVIRLLDKNGYYTTKSVQTPSLGVPIVKKVESEAGKKLESEKNLKDVKEILCDKKYTKRKKSLLKKQIST